MTKDLAPPGSAEDASAGTPESAPAGFTVLAEDARPNGKPDECFYCRAPMGGNHTAACVVNGFRLIEEVPVGVPQPISTYPEGHYVLFWFPTGERGNGQWEAAMSFLDDNGAYSVGWTAGGPNSGLDFDFAEPPTMWARLPQPPMQQT